MAALSPTLNPAQARLVSKALRTIESVWSDTDLAPLTSTALAAEYFRCRLGMLPHEEFHARWLTAQNRLIAVETLFRGTLTQTSVYPREVLKSALRHNAGGVIVAHNHPSGAPKPSAADVCLTRVLEETLAMIDVRLIDHIIVTAQASLSLRESGWPE